MSGDNFDNKLDSVSERVTEIKEQVKEIQETQLEISKKLAKKKTVGFDYEEDENKARGNWTGKLDFLLSCLGYAVGLGNVWRFPYLCYKNGGGAFFIPYVIFLFFVGIPIFLLELTLGQFSSQGPLTCWEFAPLFKGIGFGMMIVSALVSIYYNVIIAWAWWYLFASFTSELPWEKCGSWSTDLCEDNVKSLASIANCTVLGAGYRGNANNGTCYNGNRLYGLFNETAAKLAGIKRNTAANEYLNYVGLKDKVSTGIDDLGPIRWDMALAILLAWIVLFISLVKGIKSSGRVVYFTAIFPYVVLIILFVRGLTLDGHAEGIDFYIRPRTDRLGDAQVWKDAAVQIFFSLSASWGGLIALASYNRFHTDVVRDTLIVSIGNCCTSVFAGFAIFSFLGHLSLKLDKNIEDVVDSGVGLAFIVYPQAVTYLPASTFWAIIFFVMIITLGMDSQFALVETVLTSLTDQFARTLRPRKTLVLFILSVCFYLLSLTMATAGGPYMLQLMDDYSGGWNIMVISILECLAVAYVYGVRRFLSDIETMTGPRVCSVIPWCIMKWWWAFCWCIVTPGLVLFIMVFSWVKYKPSKYGKDYTFPVWANALGWLMTMFVVVSTIAPGIIMVIREKGSLLQRLTKLTTPTKAWGPALVKHRQLISYVPGFVVDPKHTLDVEVPEKVVYGNANMAYEG